MLIFPIVLYITLLCNVVIIDGGIIILKRNGPRHIPDAMGRPQTTKTPSPELASPPRLPTVFGLNNYVPLYYKTKRDRHQWEERYYDFTFAVYNHSHRVQIYEEIDGRMAEGWRQIIENGAECNWKDLPTSQWENTVDWLSRELHHFAGTVVSTPTALINSSDENNTISSIMRPVRAFGFFSSGVFEGQMIVPLDCEKNSDNNYTMWFFALAPHELKEWTEIMFRLRYGDAG